MGEYYGVGSTECPIHLAETWNIDSYQFAFGLRFLNFEAALLYPYLT